MSNSRVWFKLLPTCGVSPRAGVATALDTHVALGRELELCIFRAPRTWNVIKHHQLGPDPEPFSPLHFERDASASPMLMLARISNHSIARGRPQVEVQGCFAAAWAENSVYLLFLYRLS